MMIDIDHVSFQYSGAEQENLQDFNLQIKKGECVVLTGESGCGKTCVTRLINTLIPHFYEGEMSGAVLIDGVDTRTIQPHDLSDKIGSVFQNPRSQFFSLDTDSEIVFGMENKGMPYQVMLDRYQQTIRELHIEKLKDRNLFDLSGGQKQTIAFAICMSEQAKPVGASDKMKAKDFITLGIFTVLFFAVVMVCIFASAATVVTFAFGSAIAAIPGGIIYMLMRAKVPKAGSVLLSGVVIGLIEFLIGAGWAVAVGFIAGAVIAELLARIGHYKSFWLNTIGYSVYMMFFALGTYLPMVIMTGYVDDMSTSNGVSAEYLTELHSFMNGTMVVIIAVVTFVAGIVGALIAKGVFKKHFQKAGIV